jgi:hypothetical protein
VRDASQRRLAAVPVCGVRRDPPTDASAIVGPARTCSAGAVPASGEGLAAGLKLRTAAASRSRATAAGSLMLASPGEPGTGVPLLLNEKTEGGARTGPNTCRPWPGSARRAFRMGRAKRGGPGTATFASPTTLTSPTSPTPRAAPGEQNGSVSARRVAGGTESVATAGAGLSGPEATRVWAGKENVA